MSPTRSIFPIMFPVVPVDLGISHAMLMVDSCAKNQPRNMGDIHACIPISVCGITTIRTMIQDGGCFVQTSTSATDLACVSWIDGNQFDILLPGNCFECHSEHAIRHSFHSAVAFPIKSSVEFQIFNSDNSIVFLCKFDNTMGSFIASGFDEIALISFEVFEFLSCFYITFISMALEFTPADADISLFVPDIPSKVQLLDDIVLFENANGCKGPASDIDSNNGSIIIFSDGLFPMDCHEQIPMPFIIFDSEMRCYPAIFKKTLESLVCPILLYGECSSFPVMRNGDYRVPMFGGFESSASWNVERWRRLFNQSFIVPGCMTVFDGIDNKLRLQSRTLFHVVVFKFLKIESGAFHIGNKTIPVHQCIEKMVADVEPLFFKSMEHLLFTGCQWKNVQFDGFIEQHNYQKIIISFLVYIFCESQFFPTFSDGASLR